MKKFLTILITITLVIGSYTVISQMNEKTAHSTKTDNTVSVLYGSNGDGEKLMDLPSVKEEEKVKSQTTLVEKKDDFVEFTNELPITPKEMKLLARLVHAEAKGEPYVGKVAVATVVLNRVEDEQFPDTVKEVIYEKNAFEPVSNGSINDPADKQAFKAVQEALVTEDKGRNDELLYFYNPETATSEWIFSRKVVKTIGNHAFAI